MHCHPCQNLFIYFDNLISLFNHVLLAKRKKCIGKFLMKKHRFIAAVVDIVVAVDIVILAVVVALAQNLS